MLAQSNWPVAAVERQDRFAIGRGDQQAAAIVNAWIQIAIEIGRRIAAAGVPFARGIQADPADLAVGRRDRGNGAQIRVQIKRVVVERQQVVRDFFGLAAGRRFGRANQPPPAEHAGLGVEAGDMLLRPHVVVAHGHVHVVAVANRRAFERPAIVFRRSLRNSPHQPPFGRQIEANQIAVAGRQARLPAAGSVIGEPSRAYSRWPTTVIVNRGTPNV